MAEEIVKQVMMECTTNGSNKYYEVTLTLKSTARGSDQYSVTARYGKRVGRWLTLGGTLVPKKTSQYLRTAEQAMAALVRSRQAKGYVKFENKKTKAKNTKKVEKKEKTMEEVSLERFSFIASEF